MKNGTEPPTIITPTERSLLIYDPAITSRFGANNERCRRDATRQIATPKNTTGDFVHRRINNNEPIPFEELVVADGSSVRVCSSYGDYTNISFGNPFVSSTEERLEVRATRLDKYYVNRRQTRTQTETQLRASSVPGRFYLCRLITVTYCVGVGGCVSEGVRCTAEPPPYL